ncbi:hypothetical protein NHQ30_001044 [Ciborinia camelliae]|nr:hypothetical protein NHQ30_001044 [Ciborinia camelliae]
MTPHAEYPHFCFDPTELPEPIDGPNTESGGDGKLADGMLRTRVEEPASTENLAGAGRPVNTENSVEITNTKKLVAGVRSCQG